MDHESMTQCSMTHTPSHHVRRNKARSAFSFLEGVSVPEELNGDGRRVGYAACMALLDRDGVYGAPRFHLPGKAGHKTHVGAKSPSACPKSKVEVQRRKSDLGPWTLDVDN